MTSKLSWKVESIRLTLLDVPGDATPIDLEQLIGIPAESKVEKAAQKSISEDSQWEEGQATLVCQPGRVDFHYKIAINPALGSYGSEPNIAIEKIKPLIEKLSNIRASRLAVGAALVIPMPTKDASYTALNKLIPEVDIDPSTSDFLYQINKPISSKNVPQLTINRVSRWAAYAVQLISFGITPPPSPGSHMFGVRLELDINSSPYTPVNDLKSESILFIEILSILSDIATEVHNV